MSSGGPSGARRFLARPTNVASTRQAKTSIATPPNSHPMRSPLTRSSGVFTAASAPRSAGQPSSECAALLASMMTPATMPSAMRSRIMHPPRGA
jgi:hypothetical protein